VHFIRVFHQVHCISQLQDGLFFVLTAVDNISPSLGFEILGRIVKVLKDYCGVLDEETVFSLFLTFCVLFLRLVLPQRCFVGELHFWFQITFPSQLRLNFVLVYELLDEILDFGVPQGTSTELLKAFIFCEPQEVDASNALEQGLSALAKFSLGDSKIKSAAAAHKSVASRSSRNELFVDVLEVDARGVCVRSAVMFCFQDLCVVLDGRGNIVSRSIDGQIVMRSFLSGCPNLTVQLNDDLVVGPSGYGSVKFVDVNFHDAVVSQDFARTRMISLYPPEGEYKVIGYRAETNAPLPLVVLASFGDSERIKHDLYLRVRCELPAGMAPVPLTLR
jgi:AP-4 complex subunit mu-1